MNKTLFLTASSAIFVGIVTSFPSSSQAREVDCVNYWINPATNLVQCFDENFNYMAVPFNQSTISAFNTFDSENSIHRRATELEMIMPDLIGQKIDVAEDLLLSMGVTLGSEQVSGLDRATGEVTQQNPLPGTELIKGQSVFLQYMGATVNPAQVK